MISLYNEHILHCKYGGGGGLAAKLYPSLATHGLQPGDNCWVGQKVQLGHILWKNPGELFWPTQP